MAKEHRYIADSGIDPSPHTPAQEAYFRYQLTLGSYEYASRNGRGQRLEALGQELDERYDTYRALRDGGSVAYNIIAGGSPDLRPNELPPEMADFLREQEYACLLWGTDHGSVFVAKAHRRDIQSLRGNVPVQVRHELYDHPAAPVIRTVTTWYDKPNTPLAIECFTNIEDPEQRADFQALGHRDELRFLFYDQSLAHRLSKVVPNDDRETIARIATVADELRARIPTARYDFDAAKRGVMERTSLSD